MPVLASNPPVATQGEEQRVLVRNVSWETYERLLADCADASAPRMAYDHGELEIMSPSSEHEKLKQLLASVVEAAAEEWDIELDNLGSTTWRRRKLEQGVEADACFYIQNEAQIRGKMTIDLEIDPPPDLVIEAEITSPILDRLPIYAHLGVPEVWLITATGVRILRLIGTQYQEQQGSGVLPAFTDSALSDLVERSKPLSLLARRKMVRVWARQHNPRVP